MTCNHEKIVNSGVYSFPLSPPIFNITSSIDICIINDIIICYRFIGLFNVDFSDKTL